MNKFSYVTNDPINLLDPSGALIHKVCMLKDNGDDSGFCIGGGTVDGMWTFGNFNLQSDFFWDCTQVDCARIEWTHQNYPNLYIFQSGPDVLEEEDANGESSVVGYLGEQLPFLPVSRDPCAGIRVNFPRNLRIEQLRLTEQKYGVPLAITSLTVTPDDFTTWFSFGSTRTLYFPGGIQVSAGADINFLYSFGGLSLWTTGGQISVPLNYGLSVNVNYLRYDDVTGQFTQANATASWGPFSAGINSVAVSSLNGPKGEKARDIFDNLSSFLGQCNRP